MEVHNYLQKINLLLRRLIEGKIVLNEYPREKLLKFLEDRDENSPGKLILDTPIFADLIFNSLEHIHNADTPVKVFLIEILTIFNKNGLQFTQTQVQSYQKFFSEFSIFGRLNSVPPSNVHLACIKLATVQVSRSLGLAIIKENKLWRNILYPNIHHRPKQISDAAYNFMATLVWRLNELNNEPELIEVLEYTVEPILSSGYYDVPVLDTETDTELCDQIFSHLSALLAIMNEGDNYPPENYVKCLLLKRFIVNHRFYKVYSATKNLRLLKLLNSCLMKFAFTALRYHLANKNTDDFCNKMTAIHRNVLAFAMKKRDALAIIDFVVQSNLVWSHYEKSHATEFDFPLLLDRNGQKYDFALQIIIHLLVPIKKHVSMLRRCNELEQTEVKEQFMIKMGRTITDYIYSSCCMFGNMLAECSAASRKQIATHSLKEMLRLKGHLNKSQTGTLFQGLYYMLEVYSSDVAEGGFENENAIDEHDLRLLTHLLAALKMLLEEHNISWYESVEIINITAVLLNLLKRSFLKTMQVVQVLDLVNISVKQFLSPNMSLLVESRKESDVCTPREIGQFIKLYSQHEEWDVRDSALNLLNSCTDISFIKYVPLQRMISEHKLIILAAKAAITDPDYYSQCTALKCLATATKIDSIWQEVLIDNSHIYLQLICIMRDHDEGMVRKEAVNVLSGVYANQKLTQDFLNTLYEVMLTAAIDDLHWEVQLAALNFWKSAIHKHLTYRGMLDGKFPSVTFSKEKRKIIILNEKEIHRQLTGIMTELSSIGCLTVLLDCTNDIHNIEVMDQAYCITKDLVEMLDKYNFQKVIEIVKSEPDEVGPKNIEQTCTMSVDLIRTSEEERNNVIDSILSVDQSELIMELHDNYSQMKSEQMDIDSEYFQRRDLVKANVFLETFRSNDYSLKIKDKKNYATCVNTLDELLDDILNDKFTNNKLT